jgi:hypothetical protein
VGKIETGSSIFDGETEAVFKDEETEASDIRWSPYFRREIEGVDVGKAVPPPLHIRSD